jgi:hypothetical protein
MTKHAILPIVFLCLCIASFSQVEKGKINFGGNIGFNMTKEDTRTADSITSQSTVRSFTILPMADYFLTEKIAVGIRTGVNFSKTETPGIEPDKMIRSVYVVNPFGRYYLWKYGSSNGLFAVAGAVGIFADASLNVGFGKEKQYTGSDVVSANIRNFSIGVSPGVFYYLTNRFSFEAKFGWLGYKIEVTDGGNTKQRMHNFGFNLLPENLVFGMLYSL